MYRQNSRADKKNEGGINWRGLVMRNGVFVCHIIILNTADKHLSDFPSKVLHVRGYMTWTSSGSCINLEVTNMRMVFEKGWLCWKRVWRRGRRCGPQARGITVRRAFCLLLTQHLLPWAWAEGEVLHGFETSTVPLQSPYVLPWQRSPGPSGAAGGISVQKSWTPFVFYKCSKWLRTRNSLLLAICFLILYVMCSILCPGPSPTGRGNGTHFFEWWIVFGLGWLKQLTLSLICYGLLPARPCLFPAAVTCLLPARRKKTSKLEFTRSLIFDQTIQ